MATHLAILLKPYVEMILSGRKTIESRLTRTPLPPFEQIEPGDRIFIKISAGPIAATAVADAVRFYKDMTPRTVAAIRRQFNAGICGERDYWTLKRESRYATLVHLREVTPTRQGPSIRSQGRAWFVVSDKTAPLPSDALDPSAVRVTLSEAACRNRYVRPPARFVEPGKFELVLPDGRGVTTDLYRGMIRWRGWGRYFQDAALRGGDMLLLEPQGRHRYRVRFEPRKDEP